MPDENFGKKRGLTKTIRKFLLLNLSPAERISGYALFASLFSIIFSVLSTKTQIDLSIKNTKNSVRPLISVYRESSTTEKELGYKIVNQGLGPAIIFDMFYLRRGVKIKTNELTQYATSIDTTFWFEPFYQRSIDHESPMRVGDEWWILRINSHDINSNNWGVFTDNLNLIIRYKSLTDDTFTAFFQKMP